MNISGNIIRFPAPPPAPVRHERAEQEPAKVVGFPKPEVEESASEAMQHRGQAFAAHRIAARVADQLDSIAAL
jgi:hypothetical protein